ncbi:hypothetical protein [Flavobacterium sp. AG291]|uniref:hypothetical protein n=1 Tax=Flavobacterium sp. AG291 TaxID=2184000 RepID=UPI000E0A3DB7|nr:hypothetical protein [Flavobacterium sp. AG291]RDI10249.1 hypothetical protein DEU42_10865 [Flavobacterium sp. AG291]
MKKIVQFLSVLLIVSCSGSDESPVTNQQGTNFFKVNNTVYPIKHVYILATKYSDLDFAGYNIILTDGEISTNHDFDGVESFSDSMTHAASFFVMFDEPLTTIPKGTFKYNSSPGTRDLASYGIVDNIVVEGGEIASSNIVSKQSDLIGENGRIIITENTVDTNINFNLVTTVGQIQGQFTGTVKTNF